MLKIRNFFHVITGAFFALCLMSVSGTALAYTITLNASSATSQGTSSLDSTPVGAMVQGQSMSTTEHPITLPTRTGWTFQGYYNEGLDTTYISSSGYITTDGINTAKSLTGNTTWYALWRRDSNCSAGTYWTGSSCATCTTGYYCPNSTIVYNHTTNGAGRYACTSFRSNTITNGTGKTSKSDCLCKAGMYLSGSTCTTTSAGYYSGVDNSQTECSAGYYSTSGASSCSPVSAGYYTTGGGTSATPTANGNGCISTYSCGKVSAGYFSTGGATKSAPNSTAGGESGTGSNGCISGQTCGAVSAGYYNNGGGIKAEPQTSGEGCISGKSCGMLSAGYFSTGGAISATPNATVGGANASGMNGCVIGRCGLVSAGYYSTGGGTSATPKNADEGCLHIYSCGKVSTGYYSNGGGTSATPTSSGDCVSGRTCGYCNTWRTDTTTADAGGTGTSSCLCKAGMYLNSSNVCTTTETGYYSGISNDRSACSTWRSNTTTTSTGSTSSAACVCKAGMYLSGTTCTNASAGYYSGVSNTQTICSAGTYSTGGASACTDCNSTGYSGYTTASTGASAENMCKRDFTLWRFGATGTLTTTAGSVESGGSGNDKLVCTKGQNCYMPDSSKLSLDGWTFLGGWSQQSQPSSSPCTASFTANTSVSTSGADSLFPCAKPTVFTIPVTVIANGNTVKKGTQSLCYQLYRKDSTNEPSTTGTLVAKVYLNPNDPEPCTELGAEVTSSTQITIPTWPGHTFKGFYTNSTGGSNAISNTGYVQQGFLEGFYTSNYFSDPYSTNATNHQLYAQFETSNVQCAAGTFLVGLYGDCMTCSAGSYCPGGTYTSEDQENVGITVCGKNTYSGEGAASCTACASGYGISDNGTNAQYHNSKYQCTASITLNKNGGSGDITVYSNPVGGTTNAAITCHQDEVCSFPSTSGLTQDGYGFTGKWSKTENCSDGGATSFTNPTGTYYACKTANPITIKWIDVGTAGSGFTAVSGEANAYTSIVSFNGNITTPQAGFSKTGMTFLGWKFEK